MPKATRKSHCVNTTSDNELQADSSVSQESSSDDEVVLQSPQFKPSTRKVQAMQHLYMSYIGGPKMDWTVNDSLYYRFLKWKIKCENVLDCELAMLSEAIKCKKVVAWSGDFGIDQYISWCLLKKNYAWRYIYMDISHSVW